MYQLLVGEAGMPPLYFHEQLTFYEANDFIAGYNRRHRHTYEAARMIHGVIGGLFAKDYHLPSFPWDESEPIHEYTDEDYAQMKAEADAFAEELNARS